ncbi:hypothetical protein L195_g034465, partial [Trifolium pratense]
REECGGVNACTSTNDQQNLIEDPKLITEVTVLNEGKNDTSVINNHRVDNPELQTLNLLMKFKFIVMNDGTQSPSSVNLASLEKFFRESWTNMVEIESQENIDVACGNSDDDLIKSSTSQSPQADESQFQLVVNKKKSSKKEKPYYKVNGR